MSLLGFSLVLAAAFCHATWNYFLKRISAGAELIWLFSVVSVVLYFPVALWIVLVERPDIGLWQTIFILGSAALHLGYFLLLQIGYRTGDLSLVYPTARATGPLISTTFAVAFLGEFVSWQMALGASVIVVGVLMLTGGFNRRAERLSASLLFGLGAGTLIGAYTAWNAYAVSALLVPPLLLDYASSLGRIIVLSPVARRRWTEVMALWRNHRMAVIVIAVFNPLAYILVLYALTFTPVAYVAPTREISVLLTVLAGSLLLKEGQLAQRLVWASVIMIGTVTLVSG